MSVFLAGSKIPKTKVAAGKPIASGESVYTRWKTPVNGVAMKDSGNCVNSKFCEERQTAKAVSHG